MLKFFCLIILVFLLACSREKPADMPSIPSGASVAQPAGTAKDFKYSLEISPKSPDKNTTLRMVAKDFNIQDAKIKWFVNGEPFPGNEQYQFNPTELKKGDNVQAAVVIKDKQILSNIVKIKNTPPEIKSVKMIPEIFKPGDFVGIDVTAKDADGDQVTFAYEWKKNGQPAGASSNINTTLKRGDKIIVNITPFDGEEYGVTKTLFSEIKNFPPTIIENNDYSRLGNTYIYQIKATDYDGDALTYSLKQGPSGMIADKSTGVVKWEKPIGYNGKVSFTVSVADTYGGETTQELTLEVD